MTTNNLSLAYEATKEGSWLKEGGVILGSSIIIALFSPLAIYLPFSPVPIATQAHVVLLLSCFLGSKRAALAVLTYLFQGAIDFPVFSDGMSGVMHLAGPNGGFLLGYVAASFVTGLLMERTANRSASKAFAAMGIGNLVIYLFGLPWLSGYIGWQSAIVLGAIPFLLGDVIKLFAATKILKKFRFFNS